MSSVNRAVRCLVAGRVQGVFYRASAAQKARELGLSGWAKNLSDGRVEVVAAGDEDAVAGLAAWLWEGSRAAQVSEVIVAEWEGDVPADFKTL